MVGIGEENGNGSGKINKFLRFQLTALTATSIDFLVTFLLKEKIHLYYAWAVAVGAGTGAFTAFTINRYWVFQSLHRNPIDQGIRYLVVAAGSIILNTAGTYIITETFYFPYLISKAMIALILGFTYSYYFSKRFVFHA